MNLKSYLRGIGAGILVTAAVFLISGINDDKTMTDAQIVARAKELGMVESTTLASASNVITPSAEAIETTETDTSDAAKDDDASTDATDSAATDDEATASTDTTDKAADVATTDENNDDAVTDEDGTELVDAMPSKAVEEEISTNTNSDDSKPATTAGSDNIVIVVNSGDGSDTVARKLYDAGVVPNAHEFDLFLMANGYDRKITTGNHIISKDMTNDEIGKNLVSSTR